VLPWLGSPWRHVEAANGRAFAEALSVQAADWQNLRESHSDHALIVAGDFNQDLAATHHYGSRANRRALQKALDRAELVAHTAGDDDPVRRHSPGHASIDHVCISTTSRWRQGAIHRWPDAPAPDRRVSDHFGVAVEFELAG
jgi:endonuclease/exonuclease/phosphatase family metal-dependent hydrolase